VNSFICFQRDNTKKQTKNKNETKGTDKTNSKTLSLMETIKEKEKSFVKDIYIYDNKITTDKFHLENNIEIHRDMNTPYE